MPPIDDVSDDPLTPAEAAAAPADLVKAIEDKVQHAKVVRELLPIMFGPDPSGFVKRCNHGTADALQGQAMAIDGRKSPADGPWRL